VDKALASCSSEGAILIIVLLVSVEVSGVMIDVDMTGILIVLMMSFTAVGSGWSAMKANRPPDRSLHTIFIINIYLTQGLHHLPSCHTSDELVENGLNGS